MRVTSEPLSKRLLVGLPFIDIMISGHRATACCMISILLVCKCFIRPVACVGSGDPVRVLHLYTTITLDEVCSIYC